MYKIGDIIRYSAFGEIRRTVLVEEKDEVKNGRPGFSGVMVDDHHKPIADGHVWGYDTQIIKVVKRAT